MSIYKDYALEYLRKGYSVIPDKQGPEKKPAILKWNDYCDHFPTIEEVNEWAEIKDTNIAICLGKSSGVVVLDLDTDDQDILTQIAHILPESPVERRGSKGWARFFKYTGEETQVLQTQVGGKKQVILELLSHGKKITIPPSIHPKGMEYLWTKEPLLKIDKESLPALPPHLFQVIANKLNLEHVTNISAVKSDSGRNSLLTRYCVELIRDQVDFESAIQKLIEHDKTNNEIPLFTDSNENKTAHAVINASRFFTSHLESINVKREKQGLLPELPIGILSPASNPSCAVVDAAIQENSLVSLPSPSGTLKLIYDYILDRSYVEQPVFALSAATALLGVIASRKVVFQNATPNLYILNVASSGSGKDSCLQGLKSCLKAINAYNLIGASSYPSEASIIAFLPQQPSRLDIIDEASSFLKRASSGGAHYQSGIGDLLCELYSCSNEPYLGKVLGSDGGKRVGECYRPHLNIVCSTTYKGVSEGINTATLEKGLFARFLTFFGDSNKPAKRVKDAVPVPPELVKQLQYWYTFKNPLAPGNLDANTPPYSLSVTVEADVLIDQCFYAFDNMRCSAKESSVTRPIASRLFQHMMKLALISAIGNTVIGRLPVVSVKDVEFAFQYIMYFYQSISNFVEASLHDDERSFRFNKMLQFIKSYGTVGVTNIELVKFCKFVNPRERLELLKDMYEGQLITQKIEVKEGKTLHIFIYIGE